MNKSELLRLYSDSQACAESAGILYSTDEEVGIRRNRRGKGWSFIDADGHAITDRNLKEQLLKLAIPPAWRDVWICPGLNGHILATGLDDKGRKQYIYHPRWRAIRDTLNFYKLLNFGEHLPQIRRAIKKELSKEILLGQDQTLALMLWFLDNGYIRIGNDIYYEENESVGLATLSRDHVRLKTDVIILKFTGKSGQQQTVELQDRRTATLLKKLLKRPGDRIFVNEDGQPYTAEDCNAYLHQVADPNVSAKDFRTWGGTLAAFEHLKGQRQSDEKPEKVVVAAVDKAAKKLGNTRSVARSHYVHPHILEAYINDDFDDLYKSIKTKDRKELRKIENELLGLLEILFQKEFGLLESKSQVPTR